MESQFKLCETKEEACQILLLLRQKLMSLRFH